jgi:hypothetical protein
LQNSIPVSVLKHTAIFMQRKWKELDHVEMIPVVRKEQTYGIILTAYLAITIIEATLSNISYRHLDPRLGPG